MKIKRVIAFGIDYLLIAIISSMIFMLPMFKDYNNTYQETYNEYFEKIFSGSIELSESEQSDLQYDIYKNSVPILIIRSGSLFVYFCIVSFFTKGQTVGKKILGLRVVQVNGNELNPNLYVLRGILQTNLIFDYLSLFSFYLIEKDTWLVVNSLLSNISFFASSIIVGFIIFRDDERGLHDIICQTKVISTKEK